ncbi:phosphopentomutase isoform X2 [Parasteatoda tepidariorum]|uniref:phosphopentomutase isoform X2 n=1 Tax=Parasteatoda tepidariorum TaxID=114398 RepID=UPI001C71D1F2|nr:phosphoglucomutase-2 isoform X2 [Parasteatoda tepidariorum]
MSMINSGNKELDEKIREYLDYARGLATAKRVEDMVLQGRYAELEKIMMKRLAFGTAGLRGKMGPGYNAMNDLVIIQTSQGLASYIDSQDSDKSFKGVVIGYDSRHNSRRFAELAAVAFILKRIKVYLYDSIVPTPFVPYAVKKLGCLAGVMVTASHNPKDDNGYKILSPIDKNIEASILKNLKPWSLSSRTSLVWTSPLCFDPLPEIQCMYYRDMNVESFKGSNDGLDPPLKITFTALHGVSHTYMKKAFQKVHFDDYVAVEEQMVPDPDFPTVYFPNPEEGNCMDLSIQTADRYHSQLIVANDPDADRLAVAEKKVDGEWHTFSGNQVGALLGSWLWKNYPSDLKKNPESCFMISSAVSSKILRSISEKEGFLFVETLTGFKWMANRADEMMKQNKHFVLAFEEAIGYMCGSHVMDKDGIQAAMHLSKMATVAYKEQKTLHHLLRDIYLEYGYHTSKNSYFLCYQEENMFKMFANLRNFKGGKAKDVPEKSDYPSSLKSKTMTYEVKDVRDLTTGYDSSQPNQKSLLPASKSVQMITFYFTNGCEMTIRGSGTEPKLKYYTEMIENASESDWKKVDATLDDMVEAMTSNWIKPEKYGFLPRPK